LEDVTIIINDAPYGLERPWNALRLALALTSAAMKSKVNVFLLGDAVSIAKKGQNPPQGYYNLEKMLTDLVGKGANVRACGTCLKSRGLSEEDLVAGGDRYNDGACRMDQRKSRRLIILELSEGCKTKLLEEQKSSSVIQVDFEGTVNSSIRRVCIGI